MKRAIACKYHTLEDYLRVDGFVYMNMATNW